MTACRFRHLTLEKILREDILPALGMQVKDLAEHLGVSRQTLSIS